MATSQSTIARSYISEAIKNSSASIKACWTIVFTAATVAALTPATKALRCVLDVDDPYAIMGNSADEVHRSCQDFKLSVLGLTFWLFAIYFTTFARFYLGGLRVFDIKYNEMFSLIKFEIDVVSSQAYKDELQDKAQDHLENALRRFEAILDYNDNGRYKFEVFWLLAQSLIVVSLAYDIPTPKLFVETFAFLLFVNGIYLFWSITKSQKAITNLEHEVFPEWSASFCRTYDEKTRRALQAENLPNDAALKWALNNIFHAVIILLLLLRSKDFSIVAPLIFCSSNVLLDFILTKNFYFPKFSAKYSVLRKLKSNLDPGL